MNKQEFLAMSLPYGLHCEISNKKVCYKLANYTASDYTLEFNDKSVICTPILHPLSDLTKEIEHKGEKFVPIDWLEDKYYTLDLHKQAKTLIDDTADWIFQCDFLLVLHLIEWHFYIADLISKGEAIDVNTLPENPYK